MLHCQQNRDIVVVDLFAGAGGLSLGLEAAGFKVAVAVEKDAINCEVYQTGLTQLSHAIATCQGTVLGHQ